MMPRIGKTSWGVCIAGLANVQFMQSNKGPIGHIGPQLLLRTIKTPGWKSMSEMLHLSVTGHHHERIEQDLIAVDFRPSQPRPRPLLQGPLMRSATSCQ